MSAIDETSQDSLLATVDLGSNSFHLLIAKIQHGEMRPVVTHSDKVQLAAGLKNGLLSEEAIARGLQCLAQFRQILDTTQPDIIRVVGTNTLRAAKNAVVFENAAASILGQRIEIISGREEARLVYLGVAHTLADDAQKRLVVDIGGGSTEFIIGERFESKLLESLHMGCVSYRERFFPKGSITPELFEKAYQSAYLEVLNIRQAFCREGWREVVGSAGTLNTIATVLKIDMGREFITRKDLELLKSRLYDIGSSEGLKAINGLKSHRRSTFPAGLAICCALFDALGISEMRVSSGALREGLAYDLIGRMAHEDVRERTVSAMMNRYDVDQSNALRVEQFVEYVFGSARQAWRLSDEDGELLRWAARLHEVGLSIAHSQFHKHGQYLIDNADMPGFSTTEQKSLALLVRCHRRKFSMEPFDNVRPEKQEHMQRLCVLLRLAVLFKYVIPLDGAPKFTLVIEGNTCVLYFTQDWLSRHPLTKAELGGEQDYLKSSNFELRII